MLVDLKVRGRRVLVLGVGAAARSRSAFLTKEGARVFRIPRTGPPRTKARRGRPGGPAAELAETARWVKRWRPAVVFSLTGDGRQDRAIARAGRSVGALVYVVDAPALSDFTMPSVGSVGAIRLAVSTSGQSPAMAGLLRRRLERAIRPLEVAQVRLQGELRKSVLRSLPDMEARKEAVYRIVRHREVNRLLAARRFRQAKALARRVAASQRIRRRPVPGPG